MKRYLAFRLLAPLAAMGDLAGHTRRGGDRWPGKSAVMGMVGAALGVERDDVTGQRVLREGYGYSVLVRRPGTLLMDFHTSQTVPSSVKRPLSRKDALERAIAEGKVNTTVTTREYREDVLMDIAIDVREGSDDGADAPTRWSLEQIESALRRPRYTLYFGRKSCPLALPLAPRLVEASDSLAALRDYDAHDGHLRVRATAADETFAVLEAGALPDAPAGSRIEQRHDEAIDRRRWHFGRRDALVVPLGDRQVSTEHDR